MRGPVRQEGMRKIRLLLIISVLSACDVPDCRCVTFETGAAGVQPAQDCVALCRRASPQLIRDFGRSDAQTSCELPAFRDAHDCDECKTAFVRTFSLELANCSEPGSGGSVR